MNIRDVLARVKTGMAKTNLFTISIPFSNLSQSLEFRGKGTQLPSSELGVVEIPFRGRKIKAPGQRTFSEWSVTVMETESMEVRAKLEEWMNSMDNAETGARDGSRMVDVTVSCLTPKGTKPLTFTLFGVFPTSIAAVEMNFDEQTAPLEYQVTFQYSYHTLNSGSGSGGGSRPSDFIA